MEHRTSEALAASPFRRRLGPPAREVTLDPGRMDSHLVAFSDLNPRASEQDYKLAFGLISAAVARWMSAPSANADCSASSPERCAMMRSSICE